MRIPNLPLTREHGSWAVMAVPLLVGTAASDRLVMEHAVLVLAAAAAFLSHVPLQILLARSAGRPQSHELVASAEWWLRVLPLVVVVAVAWIVMAGGWPVLAWGALALAGFVGHHRLTRERGKSFWGDLVASTGLSAGAPAAMLLDGSGAWLRSVSLWLLVAAFFGCSVVYVHMKIRAVAMKIARPTWRQRWSFGWVTVAYHVAVILLVAGIVMTGRMSASALVAYLPMAIHAVIGTVRLSGQVRFKRLGFLLLGHSILFTMLMATALRSSP